MKVISLKLEHAELESCSCGKEGIDLWKFETEDGFEWVAVCGRCQQNGKHCNNEKEAIKAWNDMMKRKKGIKMGKASTKAQNKYIAKKYDRIALVVPKGEKDKIKEHAESMGESLNGFINRVIAEAMEKGGK